MTALTTKERDVSSTAASTPMTASVGPAPEPAPAAPGMLGPPQVASHHPLQRTVITAVERPPAELVDQYRRMYTGVVLDHLGKQGGMDSEIKPVFEGARVCGPALTAVGADWRLRMMAADLAEPGDVIVVVPGDHDRACFGDITATRFNAKGIAGVVIDGATRDLAGIRKLGFPAFARRVTPRTFHYPSGADVGAVNVPVVCGGVLVEPGDIVIGDDDGVLVVPRAVAGELASAAIGYLEKEAAKRAMFAERYVPFGVAEDLRSRGYRFV